MLAPAAKDELEVDLEIGTEVGEEVRLEVVTLGGVVAFAVVVTLVVVVAAMGADVVTPAPGIVVTTLVRQALALGRGVMTVLVRFRAFP